jgi:hypothetical protein
LRFPGHLPGEDIEMETYPKGPSIRKIASYSNKDQTVIFTVSRRSGGIGRSDYLITGTNGFTATCQTQDKAIEAAKAALARIAKNG